MEGVSRVPYKLPEILKAAHDPVLIVEGEKDADRLVSFGVVATTNPQGAGKWTPELNKWFKGKCCYILADNDDPGRKHAQAVAQNLYGVAEEIRVVDLPGLPDKGDVCDWLDADETRTADLINLCQSQSIWTPNNSAEQSGDKLGFISAYDLGNMTFPPIKYIIPGYIPEGATLLAGAPKLGKSWLVLDMALAVAHGGYCLGDVKCEQGDVLYAALEDNHRRLQSRLKKVFTYAGIRPELPKRLILKTEWPRFGAGGIEAFKAWLDDHPDARMIIVDVLAMFRALGKGKDQSPYEADYLPIKALQGLAAEYGVAIIIVHHTRKSVADTDPFDAISGTLGLSGAADTALVLRRDSAGVTLYGRGRDIEEFETALQFSKQDCRWQVLGAASDVRRSDERVDILQALLENKDPMPPADIAAATGNKPGNVRKLLHHMAKDGQVLKKGRGAWLHPDNVTDAPPKER